MPQKDAFGSWLDEILRDSVLQIQYETSIYVKCDMSMESITKLNLALVNGTRKVVCMSVLFTS